MKKNMLFFTLWCIATIYGQENSRKNILHYYAEHFEHITNSLLLESYGLSLEILIEENAIKRIIRINQLEKTFYRALDIIAIFKTSKSIDDAIQLRLKNQEFRLTKQLELFKRDWHYHKILQENTHISFYLSPDYRLKYCFF